MRAVIAVFIVAAVAVVASPASARVWFVYPDGSGDAMTIQAGIDSCAAGDTVVAMPGIFTGDGNWDIDFKGKPIVVTAATSFDSTITETTIIDCSSPDEHRAFYFHSLEDSTSVLSGFLIRNFFPWGGAISCRYSSPTISYNRIEAPGGEAIRCYCSSAKIINNTIAIYGGCPTPITCWKGSPYIAHNDCGVGGDCSFLDSSESLYCSNCASLRVLDNRIAGTVLLMDCNGTIDGNNIHGSPLVGLEIYGGTLTITNNRITSMSRSSAAAIGCRGSALIIANNWILGALFMNESLPSRIMNNEIIGRDDSGNGITYYGDSTTVIESNIIHDSWDGSGISCFSSIRIADNVIYANGHRSSLYPGGGIECGASALIEGNTIVGNRNAGIYCAPGSFAVIRNNIIANQLGLDGSGVISESSSISISCCDVYNNGNGNYIGCTVTVFA